MNTYAISIGEYLGRLTSLVDAFICISKDGNFNLDQLKRQVREFFFYHMISDENSSFYSNRLAQLEVIEDYEKFICTFKQAIAFRAHDVIDDMVELIDQDFFTQASLRHQCSRNIEKVLLLELCDDGCDTLCLIVRSNGNRILRFHKDGREVRICNLAEYEGYDHEIHYPDQLDDGQLVDFLPEIIAGFSRILLISNHTYS